MPLEKNNIGEPNENLLFLNKDIGNYDIDSYKYVFNTRDFIGYINLGAFTDKKVIFYNKAFMVNAFVAPIDFTDISFFYKDLMYLIDNNK